MGSIKGRGQRALGEDYLFLLVKDFSGAGCSTRGRGPECEVYILKRLRGLNSSGDAYWLFLF